jgi:hypothetical protein
MPLAQKTRPVMSVSLPPYLSASRPAIGALATEASDIGARIKPACSALNESTDCRKMTSGRKRPSIPKEIAATTPLITAKLRSAKIPGGTSGSRFG